MTSERSVRDLCAACREAAIILASTTFKQRKDAIRAIATEIKARQNEIFAANEKDKQASSGIKSAVFARLTVTQAAVDAVCDGLSNGLCGMSEDPIGKCDFARELAPGLKLYRTSCPIGVICVVYEARPLVAVQLAALTLLTGNGVVLKGGSEAKHSNAAMFQIIRSALEKVNAVPLDSVCLVETRSEIAELLKQDDLVDLVVPRGSKDLVKYVKANTAIPVLGHADGICSIYVDKEITDLDQAIKIVLDAKRDYPAACNAAETLLVHKDMVSTFLPAFVEAMKKTGPAVELVADKDALKYIPEARPSTEEDYHTEWLSLTLSVKVVSDVEEAIAHINSHGSKHTDVILSNIPENVDRFMAAVDAAGVYHNCSSRFADGWRYGFGAEVGISTNKIHSRGPVGTDGLLIYKYKLFGQGHTQEEMGKKWQYTHKDLPIPKRADSVRDV